MSRTGTRSHVWGPTRILWLLVGSFALTIASFVASTVVAEVRARGLEAAVDSITENAAPSISCLPVVRTQLRSIDRALQRLTRSAATGADTAADSAELRRARDSFAAQWRRCSTLPEYKPEQRLRDDIERGEARVSSAIDHVLRHIESGDRGGGLDEIAADVEPAIDAVDGDLSEAIEVNARELDVLSARIKELRTSSRTTRAVLITVSALLASIAAAVLVRVVQRFTALMEARLTEMEHFAGRVAHDVRSPLAAVGLAIELTKRAPESSVQTGVLDRASRTLQRIGQLVDGLLLFARAGAAPRDAAQADVRAVLVDVVETLRPSAEEGGIALTFDAPAKLSAACTPGVLVSIVSNLVGNAIKYMGASPVRRVHLQAQEAGGVIRFEVRDTGPGVPPAERERMFDPYVRGAAAAVPGIGLGLATVRRLAEAHGGCVGFVPNEPTGAVFWFELPRAEAQQQAKASGPPVRPPVPVSRPS